MEKNIKKEITKYEKTIKKKKRNYSWIVKITIFASLVSFTFSYFSEIVISEVNIFLSVLFLLVFIILGVIFDMIGVSATTVSVKPFHSMNAKKIKGASRAIKLISNAEKVSSFCNDVIGDICGILSGSMSVLISIDLAKILGTNIFFTTLILTSIITGLTIGGKAMGKSIAINKNVFIIYKVSKIISVFERRK